MNKLRLQLDELAVESFDTTRHGDEKGTVFGEQQCTCQTVCSCPGCPTCDYSCDDPTCVDQTCYGYTCEGSCPINGCPPQTRFCPPF